MSKLYLNLEHTPWTVGGPVFEGSLKECMAHATQKHAIAEWYCRAFDIEEGACEGCDNPKQCGSCGDDDDCDLCDLGISEKCKVIISEPLFLEGERDDDSFWVIVNE